MSRRATIIGSVLFAALIAALGFHVSTMLDSNPEQDQCSFGPITNDRYRELLSQAERIQRRQWPLVIWSEQTLQRLLNEQFQEMTKAATSTSEKIATMHAIPRGIGGDYVYTSPHNNAFSEVADHGGWVSFGYQFDVDRVAFLYPWGRNGRLIGSLTGPTPSFLVAHIKPGFEQPRGLLRLVAQYPNPFDPSGRLYRGQNPCPDVPTAAQEPLFRPEAK